jgi:purine catabolism regulator
MKGNEVALVAVETLARLGTNVARTVERLAELGGAGLVVRGEVDGEGVEAAGEHGLPLLSIEGEVPLHEIEQEIIREIVLFQARHEGAGTQGEGEWIEGLLAGEIGSAAEAQALARQEGFALPASICVAFLVPMEGAQVAVERIVGLLGRGEGKGEAGIAAHGYQGGVAAIIGPGGEEAVAERLPLEVQLQLAGGVGGARPVVKAGESLEEAKVAAMVSARLRDGALVRHSEVGADGLLALLYRDRAEELQRFVDETLGAVVKHDAKYGTHLLATVEAFVGHVGRLRETAGEIFVHRNTLAYRLQRAAELLGVDLKDADAQIAIQMALRARRFLMAPTGKRRSFRREA